MRCVERSRRRSTRADGRVPTGLAGIEDRVLGEQRGGAVDEVAAERGPARFHHPRRRGRRPHLAARPHAKG